MPSVAVETGCPRIISALEESRILLRGLLAVWGPVKAIAGAEVMSLWLSSNAYAI